MWDVHQCSSIFISRKKEVLRFTNIQMDFTQRSTIVAHLIRIKQPIVTVQWHRKWDIPDDVKQRLHWHPSDIVRVDFGRQTYLVWEARHFDPSTQRDSQTKTCLFQTKLSNRWDLNPSPSKLKNGSRNNLSWISRLCCYYQGWHISSF